MHIKYDYMCHHTKRIHMHIASHHTDKTLTQTSSQRYNKTTSPQQPDPTLCCARAFLLNECCTHSVHVLSSIRIYYYMTNVYSMCSPTYTLGENAVRSCCGRAGTPGDNWCDSAKHRRWNAVAKNHAGTRIRWRSWHTDTDIQAQVRARNSMVAIVSSCMVAKTGKIICWIQRLRMRFPRVCRRNDTYVPFDW